MNVNNDEGSGFVFAGIKIIMILAAIDGRWRCPLHWEVVTNLTGLTHARFINNMIRRWECVPAHIILDGATAWSYVEDMLEFYYGDAFDEVAHVPLAEGTVAVRRFQRTSSVHSTPIERSWADVNDVTAKYREEFQWLESQNLLRAGRSSDPLDIFCLTAVYLPMIQRDIEEHYMGMAHRKKSKATKNPYFPAGARRPLDALLDDDNHSLPVSAADIATVDAMINDHFGATYVEPAAPWEIDPLVTDADRARREQMVAASNPRSSSEEYIAMRAATKRIAGL